MFWESNCFRWWDSCTSIVSFPKMTIVLQETRHPSIFHGFDSWRCWALVTAMSHSIKWGFSFDNFTSICFVNLLSTKCSFFEYASILTHGFAFRDRQLWGFRGVRFMVEAVRGAQVWWLIYIFCFDFGLKKLSSGVQLLRLKVVWHNLLSRRIWMIRLRYHPVQD